MGSAWNTPKSDQGGWFSVKKQPEEFTRSMTTKRDIWGRERHYDSHGREIKTPDVKSQKLKKAGGW